MWSVTCRVAAARARVASRRSRRTRSSGRATRARPNKGPSSSNLGSGITRTPQSSGFSPLATRAYPRHSQAAWHRARKNHSPPGASITRAPRSSPIPRVAGSPTSRRTAPLAWKTRFATATCTSNCARRDGAADPLSFGKASLGSDRTGPECRHLRYPWKAGPCRRTALEFRRIGRPLGDERRRRGRPGVRDSCSGQRLGDGTEGRPGCVIRVSWRAGSVVVAVEERELWSYVAFHGRNDASG
jgi:hypothetical protein